MSKQNLKTLRNSVSKACLAGVQIAVLVAVVASQLGERILRGAQGFAVYRETLVEQG
ncbi:MAG: hypothetical protein ACXVB9_01010 [Bdellovibrionota bacterium]